MEPGDIILGYDGIPWKVLYKQLLEACLPITSITEPFASLTGLYTFGGSSDRSATYIWLMSAGLNWHLFDIIDIVKYGSNDTLHLQTNPLEELDTQLICTEQLPVPGVPMPDLSEVSTDMITWGVIDGTQIGYIYASHWAEFLGADIAFANAVNTLLDDYQTEGLVIDSRLNAGGQPWAAHVGFSRLFNFDLAELDFAERSDPDDHLAMQKVTSWCRGETHRFRTDTYLYDKPIAVLTGPLCWSAGDYNAMRLKFHPMTRFFGKPTNTAYTCFESFVNIHFSQEEWYGQYAPRNAFLLDNPQDFLIHVGFEVDEEVWLTQEDAAKGEDTVVERAIEWIQNLAYAHDVAVNKLYAKPGADSVLIAATVENPNQHQLSVEAVVRNTDSTITDQLALFDDGQHGDGAANDKLYGNFYLPTGEETFKISVTTTDQSEETSRTLPNVAWFTTIGPLKFDKFTITSSDDTIPHAGDRLKFEFTLKNWGEATGARNISSQIACLDTFAELPFVVQPLYGDISAGETATGNLEQFIKFSSNIPDSVYARFSMDIMSNDYIFWSDTFDIFITKDPDALVDSENHLPAAFALSQNYPNPFNPNTTIEFTLPKSEYVELKVCNILGKKVSTLVSKKLNQGNHTYTFDGSNLASGVYYYRLEAGNFVQTRKMIYLK